jgi:drug/metabolite transporter (DMT)-like permease
MKKNLFIVYLLIFLAMSFWGLSFVWVKIVYQYLKPFTIVFIRLSISAFLLFISGKLFKFLDKIDKNTIFSIMLLAFFEPFLYFIGESFGLLLVSATVGSIIIATIPVITPIFSLIFEKEKITIYGIIGLILSFIGVLLLIIFGNDHEISVENKNGISIKGILLLFFAVFSAIGYLITAKRILKKNIEPFTIVAYQNLFGAIYFLPFFLIFDFKNMMPIQDMPFEVFKNILLLAIFPSTIAFIFYNISLKEIGINRSNIFTNFIPVITAIASFFILKEKFTLIKIFSIFLIIFGVFISQIKKSYEGNYIQEY